MSTDDQSQDQTELNEQAEQAEQAVQNEHQDLLAEETAEQQAQETETAGSDDEVQALKDQVIRVQAEMQNLRRRAEKDVESAHKYGQEKLINELLPVLDNFERAIDLAPEGDESPVLEGVKMTRDILVSALEKFDVQAVDPMGEPFDPKLHQAMSMVDNPLVEANTVVAVMQKGYTLAGRLIRPAMVMVSKGGETKATTIDEQA